MTEASKNDLVVVGIGASAGGIEAFRGFFENMPPDSGMGFVVVLHLPPDRPSILPEIIGRWTAMRMVEATQGCLVEANCVYIPPSGELVTYEAGRLLLHPHAAGEPHDYYPVTALFNSLALALRENAVGIVLSGTGSDGALGLKAIKQNGGLTLVQGQNGAEPQYGGMPTSAIATGAVDLVTAVESMPRQIMAVQQMRRAPGALDTLHGPSVDQARLAICAVLKAQIGHDFSGYKDKTFLRRVQRRMQVAGDQTLEAFISRLEKDRGEVVALFHDLLIGVTSFFRDEETFEVLKQTVIPLLFEKADPDSAIRVWVPGCATGEEAYSLAMLLREHADGLPHGAPRMQVFATDIDESAISTARAGRYPSALVSGLTPERIARFFVQGVDGSYTIAKSVRELCTFSAHSLTRDPPFSRISLVSCRNLLIYLDIDLQSMVIPAFHYALAPNGILMLGSSESINRHEGLFATLDRKHRIFQKRDVPSPALLLSSQVRPKDIQPPTGRAAPSGMGARIGAARPGNWAESRLVEHYAPAFVVVTASGESVQYSSRVTRYLEVPSGVPNQNVLAMARQGLRSPLSAALREAAETGRVAERQNVAVLAADGVIRRLNLVVDPRPEQGADTLFMVVLIEIQPPGEKPAEADAAVTGTDPAEIESRAEQRLEAELRDTREQLRSMTEDHDSAVEELRSANEELHSLNEELQSANEELETSKEEIQSINEELQTVNGQLASKVDELDHRNSDLQNLFESTEVATIYLDPYMIVRSFTPAVARIYNLIPSDQGRPLTDIVSRLHGTDLRADCHQVLQTLAPLERRVASEQDGSHYLMKILPYRRPDSKVDGTVITFVDVTTIVQAEQHQRLLVDELNHRVKNMLTVVISMAMQTMRRSDNLEIFAASFMGRVHALAAAYALLSREGWQTIPLRDLLLEELKPFQDDESINISLSGPRVALDSRAALALGMAVHELTTNAVKYGALSVPGGSVVVDWRVEQNEEGAELELDWIEKDGPPVVTPTHRGFGMMLIERGLKQDMSARVDLIFPAGGVRAKVRAPFAMAAAHAPSKSED